jgi:endonuclease/exonuclease/phosphatase family metal-dependent hydrolase
MIDQAGAFGADDIHSDRRACMNRLQRELETQQTSRSPSTPADAEAGRGCLRIATYNIHKGVRGLGPGTRLEIHNLGQGVQALDADLVFLQEVQLFHHRAARRFERGPTTWPGQGQAEYLAPQGYHSIYRTNAVTRDGEHGNALLSRWPVGDAGHHDVSDHRFEQRGLLHVPVQWNGLEVHTIVAHFGLIHASRVRQAQRLADYIRVAVPQGAPLIVAGDFNDWGERLDPAMDCTGMIRAVPPDQRRAPRTFPSSMPVFSLDRVYMRGLRCSHMYAPHGPAWARMSDHLPLVVELEPV